MTPATLLTAAKESYHRVPDRLGSFTFRRILYDASLGLEWSEFEDLLPEDVAILRTCFTVEHFDGVWYISGWV